MCEDGFHKQDIGKGVPDSLVDEIGACFKGVEGVVLGWRLRFMSCDDGEGVWGEENCAVTVGFKVDSTIIPLSFMMEMFHPRRCT